MKAYNQILSNLRENKEDWYYLCNEAEQALFKVKNECKDERAIKSIERMIIELNNIRMEQYDALIEYALVEVELKESTQTFTEEEREEYNLDEEGIDENGDQWIHCEWCEDLVPLSECKKELNLGWICRGCQNALYSRGEHPVYDEQAEYTLNEEFWEDTGEKEYKGIKISIEKGDHGNTCYIPLRNKELNFSPKGGTQFFSYKEVKDYIDKELSKNNLKEETNSNDTNYKVDSIEYATPCYTGGGVYVYTGKLKDGNYFLGSDDWFSDKDNYFTFRIVNEDPDKFPDDCFFDEWQVEHLVKDLSIEENKELTKQVLNWIINNKPEGNYQIGDMQDLLSIVNK